MIKTAQPAIKPTEKGGPATGKSQSIAYYKRDFFLAAASMSWQLAIVVLVPILVGSRLDNRLHSSPLYTLVGFVLAMIGTAVVVGYQLKKLTPTKDGDDK